MPFHAALRAVLVAVALLAAAAPALAVFSGEMSPRPRSGDSDYADGIEAYDRKDWAGVVSSMSKVVARRPHHDNAWTRLGYAYRQLGRYDAALDAYYHALARNPHNRNALEYLGEAYIRLGRIDDARNMLVRLEGECRRVALLFSDGYFSDGCAEYAVLKKSLDALPARAGTTATQP
jgi:cytochrome c-type biogenesis protein CcmH/NrfG